MSMIQSQYRYFYQEATAECRTSYEYCTSTTAFFPARHRLNIQGLRLGQTTHLHCRCQKQRSRQRQSVCWWADETFETSSSNQRLTWSDDKSALYQTCDDFVQKERAISLFDFCLKRDLAFTSISKKMSLNLSLKIKLLSFIRCVLTYSAQVN